MRMPSSTGVSRWVQAVEMKVHDKRPRAARRGDGIQGAKRWLAVEAKIFSKNPCRGAFNRRTPMASEFPQARADTDEDAGFLARISREQQAPLLRYATHLLAGDVDRARDVVQDTLIKLMAQPVASVEGRST